MNLKLAAFIAINFYCTNCYSQDEASATNVAKVTFINPGISYEFPFARFHTLYAQAFMNTAFSYSASTSPYEGTTTSSSFYFDPAITFQYRYYYNLRRRAENEKRTEMNSANYLTAVYEGVFSKRPVATEYVDEEDKRMINALGLAWGLQRNYKKRFSLDFYIGLGYQFAKTTVEEYPWPKTYDNIGNLTPMGQINIGIWLNKME